jgi:hypothetical protein
LYKKKQSAYVKKNNNNNSNAKPGKRSEHGDEVLENVKNRGPGKYTNKNIKIQNREKDI